MKIFGKQVSKSIKEYIYNNVPDDSGTEDSDGPALVIIRVGEDPASIKYTNNKIKAAKECKIFPLLVELPEDTTQEKLDDTVEFFLDIFGINGLIVQLPLPKHLNTNKINELLNKYYMKDVDGFSYQNVAKLHLNEKDFYHLPCTAKGCIDLIDSVNYDIAGKVALVIGRSNIVGKPVARLLEQRNATVIQAHSKTSIDQMKELGRLADIVVVAIGKPHAYKTSMFPHASIFIDVGINVDENGKMVGDILDDSGIAESENRFITPVPGGVGPMTVANLLLNTYNSYLKEEGHLQ